MTDMARSHIPIRTWLALVALGILAIVFARLGNWQLDRAGQRDAIQARIGHAAQLPPVSLTPSTPASDMTPWRSAQARGHWLHSYTVLLENRNYQSRPGYWVATPLRLAPDRDGTALLVLRGWLAREDVVWHPDNGAAQIRPELAQELAQADGELTVSGEIFPHVPRLFELWSWSGRSRHTLPGPGGDAGSLPAIPPALQNVDVDEYARASGLKLLPIVLASTRADMGMVQDWPHPSAESDTNRGYALQWFSFCVIAAGAWLYIGWRTLKKVFE